MISDWWLVSHPDVKTLDGAAWLIGFYDRLKEEDLYVTDCKVLKLIGFGVWGGFRVRVCKIKFNI
jgi:hypothetical protein